MEPQQPQDPTTATTGASEASEAATPAATEPEFHLDAEGKVRYIWMRLGTAVFRTRIPLHVFKMDEDRKRFFLERAADRLKLQLLKDMCR